ncbi:hypothetical protein [uncultured Cyclobacterium sp.]|uniref:hypothetical protein n=1 Tax=uncultured Cyclobacterium sp. TaxID=453820 RepID=UPI0030EB5964|tara:strand:+ start:495650 stop:498841 length:3192 start_codon:yes stop_codon:yes gene_type:complete
MQPDNLNILKVLWRKGTSQAMRTNPALDPSNLELMELELGDWLLFANNFAKFIPFFPVNTSKLTIDNWQIFFKELLSVEDVPQKGTPAYGQLKESIQLKLDKFSKEGTLKPQLTLLVTFLQLLEYSRSRLNNISKRHLDFYYSNVLRFSKLPAIPDEAFLIIETGKGPKPTLTKGSTFDGGVDASGKKLTYVLEYEFFPNLAQVSQLKNRFVDTNQKKITVSQVANSVDGKGEAFKEENQGWWPFGHGLSSVSYPELQKGSFGFGISLPSLWASAASDKYFSFELTFKKNLPFAGTGSDVRQLFSAQYSGEEGWETLSPIDHPLKGDFKSSVTNNRLRIVLFISKSQPGIVDQQEKIHGDSKGKGAPLIWFDIACISQKTFNWIKGLGETPLKSLAIRSSFSNISTPIIESDLGILNPEKPFQPFGSIPKKGSSFYIKYPEWKKKKPTKVAVRGKWANTPDNFKDWYYGYRDLGGQYLSKDNYFSQHFVLSAGVSQPVKSFLLQPTGFREALLNNQISVNPAPDNLIVKSNNHFKAKLSLNDGQGWTTKVAEEVLFETDAEGFKTSFDIVPGNGKDHLDISEGIKVTLLQSFLSEMYPRLYALAMSSDQPDTPIPNEPYTPLMESLLLDYETEDSFELASTADSSLQLFVRDDFGWYEENKTTKIALSHTPDNELYAMPYPGEVGELFIGISGLAPLEQLSLLIQVLEGSENPSQTESDESDALKWFVLVSNYWKKLERENIISDQTDNLLKSGTITFSLPEEAFNSHHRMDNSLVWIKLSSPKKFNATSRILGIFSQAIKVVLLNDDNDLSHLKDGLPAESIAKMVERKAGIKRIFQPFNSFGGKAPEQDKNYYIRASERLRHKNRSVSLWDFEHLILQKFPDVYKVKCLNHTCAESFLSPGHVMVLVIPDTLNKNVYDIFQPTFSAAKLNEITRFLEEKSAPQIKIKVVNPMYEEIKIRVQVSFYPGVDKAFFMNQLSDDIINYLSPWTSGENQKIDFNSHFNKSSLVYFFEKLNYVDFIQEPRIFRNGMEMGNDILPSTPKHILVSAKSHDISLYEPITS